MQRRTEWAEGAGLAAAFLALLIVYGLFLVHPWPHTPLNQFLAMFGRNNVAVWPAQIVWYAVTLAVVGLAVRGGCRSSQLACLLAAAIFAWIGIAYFVWLNPGMNLSWAWAAVFSLQAALLLVAGVTRSDLVIRPRLDLPSLLGAVFLAYALILYPVIGLLGGHPLRNVPVFGVAPCATVTFFFGLMLWARPPAPKYLLLIPLAWALVAAPPDLGRGVAADYGMLIVAVITAGLIIWRDRTTTRQTVTAGLLLALMIGWSGHDNVMIGLALVLVVAALAQTIMSGRRSPQASQIPPPRMGKLRVS